MMDENKQLAQRINGASQSASQEVTNLRSELGATDRERDPFMENHDPQHNHHHNPSVHQRQNPPATDLCYKSDISSLMEFSTPDSSLDKDSVQL
ncbi:kazrin-A-like [Salvelinus sp. IW2-2015]|uniref:kazrin-A-like n=1 Tax=Salvelinus sp. IW2-2015 TaxID=2691554 RepID=UPI000CDFBCA5|nr:kazrin-A-like isoform X1 [Salvelinus alpinus]